MKRTFSVLFLFAALHIGVSAAGKVKVACVGNSVTYGYTIENRETDCYPAQLQRMLGDGYEVGNFGKSGATLLRKGHRPYNEQTEYADAISFAADMVVIHLGLNDTDPRNWPNYRDEFIKDYITLISDFRKANPACKIWICKMTPIFDRHSRFLSGTRDWWWAEQDKIEHVAAVSGCSLIDLYRPLHCRPDLFKDALHPNAEGAGIIARTVYGALTGDFGGLQMAATYSDNMVLQRGRPLTISGTANAGEEVTVAMAGQKERTSAADDGSWSVILKPMEAQKGLLLSVSAKSGRKVFHNVAVGEVFLASGQSNMAFRVDQCVEQQKEQMFAYAASNPDIRLLDMKERWQTYDFEWPATALDSVNRLLYYHDFKWENCNERTAAQFSAVAFSFAMHLADSLQVPIGIICNAIGGSTMESWIDRRTLEWEMPEILRDPYNNDFIQDWARGRAARNVALAEGNPLQRHPYLPAYLFESGIRPLEQFPIKGVIWYQGESNAHNPEAFKKLFKLLVKSWRNWWGDDKMPFYMVQLSSIERPSWGWIRDIQRCLAEETEYCEFAVCSDLAEPQDVHPRRKVEVGERLCKIALNRLYDRSDIEYKGPEFISAIAENGGMMVKFATASGLKTSDGGNLQGFELCGADHIYFPAKGEIISSDSVRVWSDDVAAPIAVRYAFQPYSTGNLVSGSNLPASTFCQYRY